jgi:hypothetical protein
MMALAAQGQERMPNAIHPNGAMYVFITRYKSTASERMYMKIYIHTYTHTYIYIHPLATLDLFFLPAGLKPTIKIFFHWVWDDVIKGPAVRGMRQRSSALAGRKKRSRAARGIHIYIYIYIYVCMYVCVCVYIYIYIYIYIDMQSTDQNLLYVVEVPGLIRECARNLAQCHVSITGTVVSGVSVKCPGNMTIVSHKLQQKTLQAFMMCMPRHLGSCTWCYACLLAHTHVIQSGKSNATWHRVCRYDARDATKVRHQHAKSVKALIHV